MNPASDRTSNAKAARHASAPASSAGDARTGTAASSRRIASLLMLPAAALALAASALGLLQPSVYGAVVASGQITPFLRMGSIVQDIISLPAAILLLIGAFFCLRRDRPRVFAAMLGLTAYLFYGYALYAIQGQYTSLYLMYLAIFGLSTYSLVFGLASLERMAARMPVPPRALRLAAAIFLTVTLGVLVPAWLGRMSPDILRNLAGEVYGVFVLDLAIVFPALGIVAYRLYAGRASSALPALVVLFKTFTLCLSVALGEWIKPAFGFVQDPAMIGIFTALTIISAGIGAWLYRWLGKQA